MNHKRLSALNASYHPILVNILYTDFSVMDCGCEGPLNVSTGVERGMKEGFSACDLLYRIIYSLWNLIVLQLLSEVYNHQTRSIVERTYVFIVIMMHLISPILRNDSKWSYKLLMGLCFRKMKLLASGKNWIYLIVVSHVSFNIWWICRLIRLYCYSHTTTHSPLLPSLPSPKPLSPCVLIKENSIDSELTRRKMVCLTRCRLTLYAVQFVTFSIDLINQSVILLCVSHTHTHTNGHTHNAYRLCSVANHLRMVEARMYYMGKISQNNFQVFHFHSYLSPPSRHSPRICLLFVFMEEQHVQE